jgi:hypothetical protein
MSKDSFIGEQQIKVECDFPIKTLDVAIIEEDK